LVFAKVALMPRPFGSPTPVPVPVGAAPPGRGWLRRLALLTAVLAVTAAAGTAAGGTASAAPDASTRTFVVVYAGSAADGRAALARLGATVRSENTDVGVATVSTTDAAFATRVAAEPALVGAAPDVPIGAVPGTGAGRRSGAAAQSWTASERTDTRTGGSTAGLTTTAAGGRGGSGGATSVGGEPLAGQQWDMRAIGATPTGSYRDQPGDRRVLVGIIDTGVDGSHPDIAPRFDKKLSRNFVTDIPSDPTGVELDGPCEHPSCVDPVDEDDDGHGTHVASTIGSPRNGIGIAGVAPNVTLVNIRAGQDSGYFFLQPTIDAITYAAKIGVDVVNMSFYTDPWLFNCASNPADSPAASAEQRTIIEATQRAVRFAASRGVTLVSASGNEQTDLGHPTQDDTSPDYPAAGGAAYPRTVDNSCVTMPTEAPGVVVVNSIGPSGRLAYYSNYGVEQTNVAAPGGDVREDYGTPNYRSPTNAILAAYPKNVAVATGDIDAAGNPTTPFVVRDDSGGVTSYYQYLQGTSMASPHVAGVAAILVSRFGRADRVNGGLTLDPTAVTRLLESTATATACPVVNPYIYGDPALAGYTPTCEGTKQFNGFYGHGVVSAARAATSRP
jgi:subtilisin family serine protease